MRFKRGQSVLVYGEPGTVSYIAVSGEIHVDTDSGLKVVASGSQRIKPIKKTRAIRQPYLASDAIVALQEIKLNLCTIDLHPKAREYAVELINARIKYELSR